MTFSTTTRVPGQWTTDHSTIGTVAAKDPVNWLTKNLREICGTASDLLERLTLPTNIAGMAEVEVKQEPPAKKVKIEAGSDLKNAEALLLS
eukprot:2921610-Rhodomonas_salina.1